MINTRIEHGWNTGRTRSSQKVFLDNTEDKIFDLKTSLRMPPQPQKNKKRLCRVAVQYPDTRLRRKFRGQVVNFCSFDAPLPTKSVWVSGDLDEASEECERIGRKFVDEVVDDLFLTADDFANFYPENEGYNVMVRYPELWEETSELYDWSSSERKRKDRREKGWERKYVI